MSYWKDIDGCEGQYQVSLNGEIRSLKNGIKRKLSLNKCLKYPTFCASINGKVRRIYVHRAVANAFVKRPLVMGGQFDAVVVDHINGDTEDNRFCNLRFITNRENVSRAPYRRIKRTLPAGIEKRGTRFAVRINLNGSYLDVGTFDTVPDALDGLAYAKKYGMSCARKKFMRKKSSRFVGVSFNKKSGKFYAHFTKNRKQKSLGLFEHEEDAMRARMDWEASVGLR